MNVLLWILQILLALHTVTGALWKFSNPVQTVPSLNAIPNGVWLSMSVIELLCSVGLILPAVNKKFANLVPIAAGCIALEMLTYCALHIYSGDPNYAPMAYWLVIAAISVFIAYSRFVLEPIQAYKMKNT